MTVQSAQSITVLFTTRVFSTGVGTNADSLPTGTLYLNGTANGATVTVTNISTGLYKAAVTLPTLAIGDITSISIAATVSTISDTATIWRDTKDIAADASGYTTSNLNGDLTSTMKTSVTTAATAATPTALLTSGTGTGQVTLASGILTANTNGDFTSTQKTSIGTAVAASAVASVTARVTANTDQIGGNSTAATNLSTAAQTMIAGAALTGTLTSTVFLTNLASSVDNAYKDRLCIFTSGTLIRQAKTISAYDGTLKTLTVTGGFTTAPSNSDTFIIV